jgi:hypothetical protein
MKCEKCGREHDGSFGSGRFCCRSCANSRIHSEKTKKKISDSLYKTFDVKHYRENIKCKQCGIIFEIDYTDNDIKNNSKQKYCSQMCSRMNSIKVLNDLNKKYRSIYNKKISETRKKMFKNGELNVTGGNTRWIHYKNIKVQGSYEYRMCVVLDKMKKEEIISNWEYTNDRFPYVAKDGNKHTYILDFKVFRNDGTFYYIEVKGYIRENDRLKWEAVKDSGSEIEVIFEQDIKTMETSLNIT